jgi:superfamily II DNA/RNA helicase
LARPTAVQAKAFAQVSTGADVTIGSETGSGKTLAYLLPLLDDILERKKRRAASSPSEARRLEFNDTETYDYARVMILVPNKELVQQVVRMALSLAGGPDALVHGGNQWDTNDNRNTSPRTAKTTPDRSVSAGHDDMVRIAIMPGGLREPQDFQPFRKSVGLGGTDPPVDIVISTPAAVGRLALSPLFADIETLIVDEADMLLDGGYLRPLENVLMGFRRADRLFGGVKKTQHVFVAATLPDFGRKSVDAYLQKKFPHAKNVQMTGMHNARHYGLGQSTIWIKLDSKKERMQQLIEILQTPVSAGGLQGEKTMVFLNSVEDVEAASQALTRSGVPNLPYHAKISIDERTASLETFRMYNSNALSGDDDDTTTTTAPVPILVCTDLASRGLDVAAVSAIVQLQFAGNVVAHLHRMGRCGRAGLKTGRGIVFYGEQETELVNVVRQAEEQQERMVLPGDVLEDEEAAKDDSHDEADQTGSVKDAFSRKRGFSKKRNDGKLTKTIVKIGNWLLSIT